MLKIKKLMSVLVVIALVCSAFIFSVSADSATISVNSKSQMLNSEFTVTVKYEQTKLGALSDASVTYDSNRLQFVSVTSSLGSANNDAPGNIGLYYVDQTAVGSSNSVSFDIKFKAIAEGDAKISTKGTLETADLSTESTQSNNITISIQDKSKLSGNANLKSMVLSDDIPLVPAFNKDVTTYNISVDNSVEKVLINAVAEDKDAKIAYGGSTKMKVGDNQRWVIVTAPNGTQKKYTVNIKRAAPGEVVENPDEPTVNPYEVTIGEEKWILVSEYTDDIKLAGFSVSSAVVGGVELPVLKNDITQEIVVFANTADAAKSGYFTYNEITGAFGVYRIFDTAANRYILLDVDNNLVLPKGYYKTNANIGGYDISVIKYEDAAFADFAIVYAQGQNGTKEYYRIDTKDNSLQRFPEFVAALEEAKNMTNGTIVTKFIALTNMEKLMVVAAVLAALLSVTLIVIIVVRLIRAAAYRDPDEIDEFDDLDDLDELDDFEDEEEEEIEQDENDEEEEF